MKKITLLCLVLLMGCFLFTACQKKEASTESALDTVEETLTSTQEEETVTLKVQEKAEKKMAIKKTSDSVAEKTVSANAEEIVYTKFEEKKVMYAVSSVNVRSGPSTQYEVVSHLKAQDKVEVTGQAKNGWYQLIIGENEAYVSNHFLSDQMVETASVEQAKKQKKSSASGGIIMVGDSRCVQMQKAVSGGGCAWVCENSKGYDWFVETAMPRIDAAVTDGTKIVINLGVNDPGNVKKYAELVNTKAAEWSQKGATVYFASVNPVWENPYTTQEQVETFNATIPTLLSAGIGFIDTHSWLITNGYRLVDGIHYDDPTYINIYNVIMGSI